MEGHPIERLIYSSNKWKVSGLTSNVFAMNFFKGSAPHQDLGRLATFCATFYGYLRLQGYKPEELMLFVTSRQLHADIVENLKLTPEFDGIGIIYLSKNVPHATFKTKPKVVIMACHPGGLTQKLVEPLRMVFERFCCVASGLYLIGDVGNTFRDLPGSRAYGMLLDRHLVGDSLMLKCPQHGSESRVKKPSHFTQRNRCLEPCDFILRCGHNCPNLCHLQDPDHKEPGLCKQPCFKHCVNGHPCKGSCGSECKPCQVEMTRDFSCGHSLRFKCNQGIPSTCSDLPGAIVKACGHRSKGICNGREAICTKRIEKMMPCRKHHYKGPCGKQEPVCQAVNRSECGHFVVIRCGQMIDEELKKPCKEVCERRCRIGHMCGDHPCGEPCPPCITPRRGLYSKNCGHFYEFPCSTSDTKTRRVCPNPCQRKRRCEHPCELFCGGHEGDQCPPCEVITTTTRACGHQWTRPCHITEEMQPCMELADASSKAMCGHAIQLPCAEVEKCLDGEASFDCNATCGAYLDSAEGGCGHSCEQICYKCIDTGIHGGCKKPCGRSLLCGHKCEATCEVLCPPCGQPCENNCEHGECGKVCALSCDPCQEPCTYGCVHGKCSKKCGEPCDKEPCFQPCTMKIQCGHGCAGYCGEPCPPLCVFCDAKELLSNDVLGKTDFTREDRFVLLVDCGHTVDAEALGGIMNINGVAGQISYKACPFCRTVIRKCRRFQPKVVEVQEDLDRVKKIIIGTREDIRSSRDEALQFVEKDYGEASSTPFTDLSSRISTALAELNPDDPNFNPVTEWLGKARNVLTIARLYRRGVDIHKEAANIPEDLRQRLRWNVASVLDAIMCYDWPINDYHLKEVLNEWDRVIDMDKLYSKERKDQPITVKRLLNHPTRLEIFNQARSILDKPGSYRRSDKEQFAETLQELEAALESRLGVSDTERVDILKAFDYSKGRWFKCPNGHIYVITECGGATQEGVCNECGATVGGSDHSVVPTNDLATEMDGAVEPLYPTALSRRHNRR